MAKLYRVLATLTVLALATLASWAQVELSFGAGAFANRWVSGGVYAGWMLLKG